MKTKSFLVIAFLAVPLLRINAVSEVYLGPGFPNYIEKEKNFQENVIHSPFPEGAILAGEVFFYHNSTQIHKNSRPALDLIARRLGELKGQYPGSRILFAGTTDRTGDEKYNLELGLLRAESLAKNLASRVSLGTVTLRSYGKALKTDDGSPARAARVYVVPEDNTPTHWQYDENAMAFTAGFLLLVVFVAFILIFAYTNNRRHR